MRAETTLRLRRRGGSAVPPGRIRFSNKPGARAARLNAVATARAVLNAERGLSVDYVAVADLDGLTLAAAVRVGATRLIDNTSLS